MNGADTAECYRPGMSEHAIRAFWEFWRASGASLARAIEDRSLDAWTERISARIDAIHPRLDWEFGKGLRAEHYFCISAAADPELRVIAERWRAAGPRDGPVFEFHAARPGGGYDPAWELAFDEVRFGLGAFRIAVEEDGSAERLHLRVHHPAFEAADEELRAKATYIALDSVLGEDDTERWLGAVERVEAVQGEAVDLGGLAERVSELRRRATGECFSLLEGTLPSGARSVAVINRAIKRLDHLLLDTHVEVVSPLQEPTPAGLNTADEGAELNELEDELLQQLGHDVVFVGHETREGTRIVHLHAAGAGPAGHRLEEWARETRAGGREVALRGAHDPAWEVLRRW